MKDETAKKIIDVMGGCFICSIPVLLIGSMVDHALGINAFTIIGLLMLAPMMIGAVFSIAGLWAKTVSTIAEKVVGNGLATKTIFLIVFIVVLMAFVLLGNPDATGPRFWGYID